MSAKNTPTSTPVSSPDAACCDKFVLKIKNAAEALFVTECKKVLKESPLGAIIPEKLLEESVLELPKKEK